MGGGVGVTNTTMLLISIAYIITVYIGIRYMSSWCLKEYGRITMGDLPFIFFNSLILPLWLGFIYDEYENFVLFGKKGDGEEH